MSEKQLPTWMLFVLVWLPMSIVAWVGAICISWAWLKDAGLVGGA